MLFSQRSDFFVNCKYIALFCFVLIACLCITSKKRDITYTIRWEISK